MKKPVIVTLLIFGVLAFAVGAWSVSTLNNERHVKNAFVAQAKRNELMYDTMWKTIKQKASITDEYKNQFREVFSAIMSENKSREGGALAKFVTESNPDFDASLLKDLSRSVESLRREFMAEQDKSLRLKNEWDNIYSNIGSGTLMGWAGREQDEEMLIVTSAKTKAVFEKGEENEEDMDLFPK
tara:strand:- start:646 stop:1197 length:552 start_codon:yes stop_codon:yes gene_type:complete